MDTEQREVQLTSFPQRSGVTSQNQKPICKKINKKVIPALLASRLDARKKSKVSFIIAIVFNFVLLILSGFFFDCYYNTRDYIIDGDYFWEFYQRQGLPNKAVPLNAMLTGMICILTFGFNLMNLIVVALFVVFGGVRDRIKFASKS